MPFTESLGALMPDFVKAVLNGVINAIARFRLKSEYHAIVTKVFKGLGVLNGTYKDWTYRLAVSGNTAISSDRLDSFVEISEYLKSAITYGSSKKMKTAFANCQKILEDLHSIFCEYGECSRSGEVCYIEKFYSRMPHNPNYNEDLEKYKEIIFLIADLTLELTRNLNYMLKRVRKVEKSFHNDLPTIYISGTDHSMTFPKDQLIPHKDLSSFLRQRPIRKEEFYSTSPIDATILS